MKTAVLVTIIAISFQILAFLFAFEMLMRAWGIFK